MKAISWAAYGLKQSPYSTQPLFEGSEIPIEQAFVGRAREREQLDSFFSSEEQGCVVIEGDVGVGKTSLANFEKAVWKKGKSGKKLFSFRREIEANARTLSKSMFILEIIGSVLREIELIDRKLLEDDDLLQRLNQMVDTTMSTYTSLSSQVGGSIGFMNSSISTQEQRERVLPIEITTVFLEKSLHQLVERIRMIKIRGHQYNGLIIHMNNFDVMLDDSANRKQVRAFFQEVRDLLQTPHVFFLFLGPKSFFTNSIRPAARVRALFSPQPLILNPLSKQELIEALDERMELLKSDNVSAVIRPVEDRVIEHYYDMYTGDLRSIFMALTAIVRQASMEMVHTLTIDEAAVYLAKERWDGLKSQLTSEQRGILLLLLAYDRPFTQSELAKQLDKAPTNISGYYFAPLRDLGVIEVVEEKGRQKWWSVTREFFPLKEAIRVQQKLTQSE